jgi:hypothetical protein
MQCTKEALFDDLVGAGEHRVGYSPSALAVLRSITSSNLLMTGPGWRFKIRKPLLRTGQIGQGRVYFRPPGT